MLFVVLMLFFFSVVDWQIVGKFEDIKLEMKLCEVNKNEGM